MAQAKKRKKTGTASRPGGPGQAGRAGRVTASGGPGPTGAVEAPGPASDAGPGVPAQNGPSRAGSTQNGPTGNGPSRAGSTGNGPSQAGSTQNGPSRAGSTGNGPSRAVPSQALPPGLRRLSGPDGLQNSSSSTLAPAQPGPRTSAGKPARGTAAAPADLTAAQAEAAAALGARGVVPGLASAPDSRPRLASRASATATDTPNGATTADPAKADKTNAAKADRTNAAKADKTKASKTKASTAADAEIAEEDIPGWAAQALEQMLHVICWLDPGDTGERYTATVRFTGQRADVTGRPGPGDTFTQDETYAGILPGSGPVAVTAEVHGINPGNWAVTARVLPGTVPAGARPRLAAAGRVPPPRRIRVPDGPATTLRTATKLRSKVPGIIRYAYAPLCVLGVLVGLILEGLLLSNAHYPLLGPIGFSVAAVAAGVAGGKTWYGAVHEWRKWDGWCIQGFVAGAAIIVAIVAVVGPGLPPGAYLAAATPALLIGMGIGRHACFFAGCCTGRPTAWRGGVWSSDRRLGCRRMPVQLYEAWTALATGGAALATVLVHGLAQSGPVAVAALAFYTLIRQGILGLRDEPRAWRYGRPLTATLAALALIAGVLLLAV